ncbi:MAG: DnaA ATPase domain-containing protein [Rhodoferax sp.]
MTFANFESRPGNVHARSAALWFASCRGTVCCEHILILADRKGVGKTHLLHATANLIRSNKTIHGDITLSAGRLAEEVQRATEYDDLPCWSNRLASEDFLAIDDVDDRFCRVEVADFLLEVLRLRLDSRRRTVLSATLTMAQDVSCPLNTFLNRQTAVRLI